MLFGTDRDYTNGALLSWTSGRGVLPRPLKRFGEHIGIALGQNIYTPPRISNTILTDSDRPYAGWAYLASAVSHQDRQGFQLIILSLGVVGPSALGQQTQNEAHKIFTSSAARGWSTQLQNEPAVTFGYTKGWNLVKGEFGNITPYAGATIGNVFDFAEAGLTLRTGVHVPNDIGPPRVAPGPPGTDAIEQTFPWGWYVYATADARAVARNIFLDGNTFAASRHVEKRPVVADLQAGTAFLFHDTRVSFSAIMRTSEVQLVTKADFFASVSISKIL